MQRASCSKTDWRLCGPGLTSRIAESRKSKPSLKLMAGASAFPIQAFGSHSKSLKVKSPQRTIVAPAAVRRPKFVRDVQIDLLSQRFMTASGLIAPRYCASNAIASGDNEIITLPMFIRTILRNLLVAVSGAIRQARRSGAKNYRLRACISNNHDGCLVEIRVGA